MGSLFICIDLYMHACESDNRRLRAEEVLTYESIVKMSEGDKPGDLAARIKRSVEGHNNQTAFLLWGPACNQSEVVTATEPEQAPATLRQRLKIFLSKLGGSKNSLDMNDRQTA